MKCKFKKTTGEQCKANAIYGGDFCFWHSPEISQEEKQDARVRGGKATKITITEPLEPIEINDTKDVVSLITDTINKVRDGSMDIKIANCLGYLAGHAIKGLENSEIEKRLESLEDKISEKYY